MAERRPARLVPIALLVVLPGLVGALQSPRPGHFSAMTVGAAFADGWRLVTLGEARPTRFALVEEADGPVVRAEAVAAAASLARAVRWDATRHPRLRWRWRVDRVVERGDLHSKAGDDYAARLYVLFDYPVERLSLWQRTRLRLARWLYGDDVPAAALCYVWDNRAPPGTRAWNAYTDRVRMVVLRNAASAVGEWVMEERDLVADFREAFGEAPPPVQGIAIAADTDQTGEAVTAWFGDIQVADPP